MNNLNLSTVPSNVFPSTTFTNSLNNQGSTNIRPTCNDNVLAAAASQTIAARRIEKRYHFYSYPALQEKEYFLSRKVDRSDPNALFIGSLPKDFSRKHLISIFQHLGVPPDAMSNIWRSEIGFCCLALFNEAHANKAVLSLHKSISLDTEGYWLSNNENSAFIQEESLINQTSSKIQKVITGRMPSLTIIKSKNKNSTHINSLDNKEIKPIKSFDNDNDEVPVADKDDSDFITQNVTDHPPLKKVFILIQGPKQEKKNLTSSNNNAIATHSPQINIPAATAQSTPAPSNLQDNSLNPATSTSSKKRSSLAHAFLDPISNIIRDNAAFQASHTSSAP